MQRRLSTSILAGLVIVVALSALLVNVQHIQAQDGQPAVAAVSGDAHGSTAALPDADPISCGGSISANINPAGDVDYYSFTGSAGQVIVADISASINGSYLDSQLALLDSDGSTLLDVNDDFAGSSDSHIEHGLNHAGTFYLMVQDADDMAGGEDYFYSLSLVCHSPPEIGVTPGSVAVALLTGQSGTRTLVIQNSGPGTLSFRISEHETTAGASASTSSAGTVQILAWVRFADYYQEYANTLAALGQYFSDFTVTESNALDPVALAAALVDKDVLLLPHPDQGSSAELQAAATTLRPALQAFVSSGHVIIAACEWIGYEGFLRSAGLLDAQYFDGCGPGPGCPWSLPVVDRAHPLAAGVSAPAQGANATASYTINGANVHTVVTSPGGQPVVATREIDAGRVVLIGYDYFTYNSDAAHIIANAVQWAQSRPDVPWLSAAPTSGSLPPSGNQNVVITLDATGLAPGTYTANLPIFNNDPDETLVTVPVTLVVSSSLPGDMNGDCRVDIVDIMLVASRWNTAQGDPQYDARYDVNSDGRIDIVDIMQVASRWGTSCSGAAL